MEDISQSLAPLRDVVSSLGRAASGHVPKGVERRRLVRRAKAAGVAALPSLFRSFCGLIQSEWTWAGYLLKTIGGPRVVERLSSLLAEDSLEDSIKVRALGLLADLKAPTPSNIVLRDPDSLLENSVRELLSNLSNRSDVNQAVELILEQVPPSDIGVFVREVLDHGAGSAGKLIRALIADSRTPAQAVHDLTSILTTADGDNPLKKYEDILASGLKMMQEGRPQRARRYLERVIMAYPDNPEARSALGVCLIELNEPHLAVVHLQRAAELEPGNALHLWNLAAAARASEQMGICYKALQSYKRIVDMDFGSLERQREAASFCRAYENMLQEAYPGVPLPQVLMGEEMFSRAYAALSTAQYDEAMERFHEVLALVPKHYPSWGNLGAAYLAMDRREEALHCLHRALELNPNYTIARENLALIEGR